MGIYYVRLGGLGGEKAELEISADDVTCTSGDTTHFVFDLEHLVLAEQTRCDTILLNFFSDFVDPEAGMVMLQAVITSRSCFSIMGELVPSTKVKGAATLGDDGDRRTVQR